MKHTINFTEFEDTFAATRPQHFSHEGLGALFSYLEELEMSGSNEIEFDVIDLCCNYTEYENFQEFQEEYGKKYETMKDIERQTTVIPITNSDKFIIGNF